MFILEFGIGECLVNCGVDCNFLIFVWSFFFLVFMVLRLVNKLFLFILVLYFNWVIIFYKCIWLILYLVNFVFGKFGIW